MLAKAAFCLFFILPSILADTPANCTYDDIVGKWVFSEGERGNSLNIDCTDPQNLSHETQVELLFPNIVIDQYGNKGYWTLIYNQGFEVTINSRKYFGFSNWTQISPTQAESRCFETKPGWSHDIYVRDWACFVGKRQGQQVPKAHKAITRTAEMLLHQELGSKMFRVNRDMIQKINTMQNSWKAAEYPEHEQYTQLDMLRRMGGIRSRIVGRPKPAPVNPRIRLLADQLPTSFDWRNVSGVNYISPVRDQGKCGSCFAFASTALLEARYRIATDNLEKLVFSPEDVVECSEYSQGCDGGFPYLIAGKYAEDFGFVLEDCNPYKQSPKNMTQCTTRSSCRRFYATDYHYVGGYYGATNEPLMRLALVNNGPIAIGFEAYHDLKTYKSGVYHHTGVSDRLNQLNKWDPFQITNHAVLIVGYGVEQGTNQPYWIVKNSWGTTWGENGFFRIRRGTDECGIESIAFEVTPIPTY